MTMQNMRDQPVHAMLMPCRRVQDAPTFSPATFLHYRLIALHDVRFFIAARY